MKKLMSLLICILLVSVVFLSGCTEESDDNLPGQNTIDSDQDGIGDGADDFPFDPAFQTLDVIWGPITLVLEEGDSVAQDYNLEEPWGAIFVNWRLINASSLSESDQHNITFDITKPSASPYTTRFYQDNMTARVLYYYLNYPDMGPWNFLFTNHGKISVSLYIEIYWAH